MIKNKANKPIDWKQQVSDYRSSGLSVKQWCIQNKVKESTMNYYVYTVYKSTSNKPDTQKMIKLVPFDTASHILKPIEIMIGSAIIKVDKHTDLELLANLVKVLQND